jgi:hypothetical protein
MPSTEAGGQAGNPNSYVIDYRMSPSGKYLAVAGTSGLQVFHFNGAAPITKYTGLIVKDQVDQVFWDNSNHLYAIGYSAQKLWVFTVTSSSVTQAPGSPHTITGVQLKSPRRRSASGGFCTIALSRYQYHGGALSWRKIQ